MATNEEKREERRKETAEVFTPPFLVRDMLNKLPDEVWLPDKTFCDPACGNGNFLIAILIRKIENGQTPIEALKTIYGVDIMMDNIRECRLRLLKVCTIYGDTVAEEHVKTVMKNIVRINLLKHPGGSLDYDFKFDNSPKKADIELYLKNMNEQHQLDQVELPVSDEEFTPVIPPDALPTYYGNSAFDEFN